MNWIAKIAFELCVPVQGTLVIVFAGKKYVIYFSDNYSCVSAERDHKYFFCSNAENCTGPHSGAIQVNEKSCPSGAYCCSWGE